MDPRVEPRDDLARLEVPHLGQVAPVEPLEQQGAPVRVGAQQPDRAVAVPVLQHQRLVHGLVVAVEADLEHRRLAVRR